MAKRRKKTKKLAWGIKLKDGSLDIVLYRSRREAQTMIDQDRVRFAGHDVVPASALFYEAKPVRVEVHEI